MRGPLLGGYIGEAAAGAGNPSFNATPVQITIGGASTTAVSVDTIQQTDVLSVPWTGAKDLAIAVNLNNIYAQQDGLGAVVDAFYKVSSAEASLVTKSGYSTINGQAYTVDAIEFNGCSVLGSIKNKYIVCDGNSLTSGFGLTIGSYPSQLAFSERWGTTYFNTGIPGATTSQLIVDNNTGPLYKAGVGAIAILWEVTNELMASVSAATAVANYWTWCDAVRAQGDKVVAVTVLPRSGSGTPVGFETARQTANTAIRANYVSHADALADVGGDATIGQAGDSTNATYYQSDQIHLTLAGYSIAYPYMKTAVDSL